MDVYRFKLTGVKKMKDTKSKKGKTNGGNGRLLVVIVVVLVVGSGSYLFFKYASHRLSHARI